MDKTLTEIAAGAPKFYTNKHEAIADARTRKNGRVIYSLAPGSKLGEPRQQWGYWAEDDSNGFIRNWEHEVPLGKTQVRRRA